MKRSIAVAVGLALLLCVEVALLVCPATAAPAAEPVHAAMDARDVPGVHRGDPDQPAGAACDGCRAGLGPLWCLLCGGQRLYDGLGDWW